MGYVPTKRCSDLKKHDRHPWKEGPFPRECPGRISDKKPSRSRREDHPRNKR